MFLANKKRGMYTYKGLIFFSQQTFFFLQYDLSIGHKILDEAKLSSSLGDVFKLVIIKMKE